MYICLFVEVMSQKCLNEWRSRIRNYLFSNAFLSLIQSRLLLYFSLTMNSVTNSNQNVNVKHVATLFEEVQSRYVQKLTNIDEKHITLDERHKVYLYSIKYA